MDYLATSMVTITEPGTLNASVPASIFAIRFVASGNQLVCGCLHRLLLRNSS